MNSREEEDFYEDKEQSEYEEWKQLDDAQRYRDIVSEDKRAY